jgi:hypothetical protein
MSGAKRSIREKSVDELLGTAIADPAGLPIPERLVGVRRVTIGVLSDWDLAFLLRQRQAPRYLIPMALERLEADLWCDADLRPYLSVTPMGLTSAARRL